MTGPRRYGRTRSKCAFLAALVAMMGSFVVAGTPAAHAEDPGFLEISKSVPGWDEGHVVVPGEQFVYTITITCSNIGSGGCTNAVLTDSLPDGVLFDPDSGVSVTGASAEVAAGDGELTVTFTDPLTDPPGEQGLPDAAAVTVLVPVMVDPNISPDLDGQELMNTAVVDGTNTEPAEDSFTVVPDIPIDLVATTSKEFDPDAAIASPGTPTTLTLAGGSDSNVAVDEVTITDPGDPSATPTAFTYLGLDDSTTPVSLAVTMPPGAEQVRVDVFVGNAWVEGEAGPPPATIPAGVDPADVAGIRITP